MSIHAAIKCFNENQVIFKTDAEKYNYYLGLSSLASKNYSVAKKCFAENVKLFGQGSAAEQFNLYNGLWNLADAMEAGAF